jgi:hypothetical protein
MRQKGFASVILILIVIILALGGMYYYNSLKELKTAPPVQVNTQSSTTKETKTVYINDRKNKFTSEDAGYSFEYQYNYYLNYNPATKGFVMGEGASPYFYTDSLPEDLYGGYGTGADDEGTVYTKEFKTTKGYQVNQSITIKSVDHPQGLGTINTIIIDPKNTQRKFILVDFIDNRLSKLQKEKNLKNLTEEDFSQILDSVKINNQIIDTLEFL